MANSTLTNKPDFRIITQGNRNTDGLWWMLIDKAGDQYPGRISSEMLKDWLGLTYEGGFLLLDWWKRIDRSGFMAEEETDIAFDDTTYTFTLSDLGEGWSYFRSGYLHTIHGDRELVIGDTTPPASGVYYISIDDTAGTLEYSTTEWTLLDSKVPVASIIWNDTQTPKYFLCDERHTCLIDKRWHWEHHNTEGTEMLSGGALSGYTVAPASPSNVHNTFGIASASIVDEDLTHVLNAFIDPSGSVDAYMVFYQSGGNYIWDLSEVPYRYTAASYIQWDNAGVMTTGSNNKYYNSYLLFTTIEGDYRFVIISGQGEYGTLKEAQDESPVTFDFTGFSLPESVIAWQLTWQSNASYSTFGKVRLAAEPKRIDFTTRGGTASGNIIHNLTAGLQGGDSILNEYWHLTKSEYDNKLGILNYSTIHPSTDSGYTWATNDLVASGFNKTLNIVAGTNISIETDNALNGLKINSTYTYTHPTQAAISENNSNGVVLQDIEVNTLGHTTSVGHVDLDLRYMQLISGTEGQTLYYNNSTSLWTANNILHVDATNTRVGINQTSPSYLLDVNGIGRFATYATMPTIKLTTGATSGYYWKCTNTDGSGQWASVAASLIYKGTIDGSTGIPTGSGTALIDGTGTTGWFYRCVMAGTYDYGNPSGNSVALSLGDDIYYNGTQWEKIPAAGYTLPIASDVILGGIMVGSGLSIDSGTGELSVVGFEPDLGNPAVDGYILSSTVAGVRSWVAPYSHPTMTAISENNANGVVLQDIEINTLGHVTSVGHVDLDTRYSLLGHTHSYDDYGSWSFAVDSVTQDAITSGGILDFVSGTGMTITRSALNQLTFTNNAPDQVVSLTAGTGINITGTYPNFTIASTVSAAALTRVNDTNVTLTLGGSPTTALLAATSITVGWTGTLADARIASSSNWNSKQAGHANLTSLSALTYSATAFVKMTGASTFALDTNTYATTTSLGNYLPLAGGTMIGNIVLNDNVMINFGTSGSTDTKLYWNGTSLYVQTSNHVHFQDTSGNLLFESNSSGFNIRDTKTYQINGVNILANVVWNTTAVTSGHVAIFSDSTGKLIGDGGLLGSAAFTASTAYVASSILTTKGDLLGYNGSAYVRAGVGAAPNGYVLTTDNTFASGWKWAAVPTGVSLSGSTNQIPYISGGSALTGTSYFNKTASGIALNYGYYFYFDAAMTSYMVNLSGSEIYLGFGGANRFKIDSTYTTIYAPSLTTQLQTYNSYVKISSGDLIVDDNYIYLGNYSTNYMQIYSDRTANSYIRNVVSSVTKTSLHLGSSNARLYSSTATSYLDVGTLQTTVYGTTFVVDSGTSHFKNSVYLDDNINIYFGSGGSADSYMWWDGSVGRLIITSSGYHIFGDTSYNILAQTTSSGFNILASKAYGVGGVYGYTGTINLTTASSLVVKGGIITSYT